MDLGKRGQCRPGGVMHRELKHECKGSWNKLKIPWKASGEAGLMVMPTGCKHL